MGSFAIRLKEGQFNHRDTEKRLKKTLVTEVTEKGEDIIASRFLHDYSGLRKRVSKACVIMRES